MSSDGEFPGSEYVSWSECAHEWERTETQTTVVVSCSKCGWLNARPKKPPVALALESLPCVRCMIKTSLRYMGEPMHPGCATRARDERSGRTPPPGGRPG